LVKNVFLNLTLKI
jgi:hypothetical protein